MTLKELLDVSVTDGRALDISDLNTEQQLEDYAFTDTDGTPQIRLHFSDEEPTDVTIIATHPMLLPLYGAKVDSVYAQDSILNVWLDLFSVRKALFDLFNPGKADA